MTPRGAIGNYFGELSERFGAAWNRFWFTPSDPRMLGWMRLLAGALACYLYATLAPDLDRFFGPEGWLPVSAVEALENAEGASGWSFFNYVSTPGQLWAAYAIGGIALVLFTIGLATRLTSILALVVMLSVVHRAPMLTTACEPVLTMVMFYLCLAPSGAAASVDAWRDRKRLETQAKIQGTTTAATRLSTAATIATRLIQVHLALLIAVMGTSKLMGDTWWSGTAMWYLIARPDSRLVDLTWLSDHPFLINAWTHTVILFELAFPILIWNTLARPLLLAAGALVWISLALVMGQMTFALVMIIASLAYISPSMIVRRA